MIRVPEGDLDWDDDDLPSYQGEPFTGEAVEIAPNGQLLSLTTFVNGRPDGPHQVWGEGGVLVAEGTSRRGRPVGVQRQWYDSGAPKVESEIDENGETVRYRAWDENGNITSDWP
jgi:antitoxin component YwqK of YwqJK toxin-antitoxin module